MELNDLHQWIGRTQTAIDGVTPAPIAAFAATLDRSDPRARRGDALPLLWHWLYFQPNHRQSELADDGHARLGGFLPPVPLPRRMWAGGRIEVVRPLRVGDAITRLSRIENLIHKEGRTGPLIFVTVRHEISSQDGPALIETQDLVYRENAKPGNAAPPAQTAPHDALWSREIRSDAVMLFRYSALTFNGHRIHYDRRFALEQGYGGLVVHGPLIATLLADLVARHLPEAAITAFSYRAIAPLFDTEPFLMCGRPEANGQDIKLWATGPGNILAMEATATLSRPL